MFCMELGIEIDVLTENSDIHIGSKLVCDKVLQVNAIDRTCLEMKIMDQLGIYRLNSCIYIELLIYCILLLCFVVYFTIVRHVSF